MLTIIVTPHPTENGRKHASLFDAALEGDTKILCTSKQPFLDGARKLLARGHDPTTLLVMRWAGAKDWALRGPLGAAAKLTVDEHNSALAKWKPYSRSAPRKSATAELSENDRAPQQMTAGDRLNRAIPTIRCDDTKTAVALVSHNSLDEIEPN
jgi:hypothetical protein